MLRVRNLEQSLKLSYEFHVNYKTNTSLCVYVCETCTFKTYNLGSSMALWHPRKPQASRKVSSHRCRLINLMTETEYVLNLRLMGNKPQLGLNE